jgi:MoxR-like ATPase
LVLADEINRAPSKVQSALLEAMQERTITIGDETFHLEEPFLVLATQNPIEQEGLILFQKHKWIVFIKSESELSWKNG